MDFTPTHKGLLFGFVPVYCDLADGKCSSATVRSYLRCKASDKDRPAVQGRNYLCEIILDMCEPIFMLCVFVRSCFDHDYEPHYPIKLTEKIKKAE